MRTILLLIYVALTLIGCGESQIDGCKEYASKYSCDYVENQATYNIYFYFSANGSKSKEYYLGTAKGLRQCGIQARSYALQKANGSINYDWSYICCMKTKESSCEEKHR
jgi:hypothetical protein